MPLSRHLDRAYDIATGLLLSGALFLSVRGLSSGFEMPLLDHHTFRQTQTAIGAYWMAHGSDWLAYETPVFGAPYSMPFEFPLYQWLTVIVHQLGVPLDQAGRAVSISFFLGCLLPFSRILRSFGASREVRRCMLAVLATSPLYIYYGRAFLIESTALFFSLSALSIGVEILDDARDRPRDKRLIWLALSATLAMLVKVTTGFIYLGALGLLYVWSVLEDREHMQRWRHYAYIAIAAFLIPLLPLLLWTGYADWLKTQNVLTANELTSSMLGQWTYGTWDQKLSGDTWRTFWERSLTEFQGSQAGFSAFTAIALIGARSYRNFVACALGLLAGYAVFTNLHRVHDYYQYATGAIAMLVMGVGMDVAERWAGKTRAAILLPVLTFLMVWRAQDAYQDFYAYAQVNMDRTPLQVAEFIKQTTPKNGLLMIYGDDWSPALPYYAERRAIMDRWGRGPDDASMREAVQSSANMGNPLRAVVFCERDRQNKQRARTWLAHAPVCRNFVHCDVCL